MRPTRAAWFFAAGLAWLVLRGILAHAIPQLRPDQVAQQGGALLLVSLISLAASLTAPVFFVSFLVHHRFRDRRGLHAATVFAVAASAASFALVLASFLAQMRGVKLVGGQLGEVVSWVIALIPFFFVMSILIFLVAFALQGGGDDRLRLAAVVGAVGTLIPLALIAAWMLHSRYGGTLPWYPGFSQSLAARTMGLAAAAALFWFLETFAVGYDRGGDRSG